MIFHLLYRYVFALVVKLKLASWTGNFDYKRRRRFNLGDFLGRRHAGFNPVRTEDDSSGELDPLNSGSDNNDDDDDEIDEFNVTNSNRA